MPFLYQEDGVMHLLFGKDCGLQMAEGDWKQRYRVFREPWLSDPKLDQQREGLQKSHDRGQGILWKTFLINDNFKGEAVRAPGFESPEMTIECSPFIINGRPHCIWTPDDKSHRILKDRWSTSPFGWGVRRYSIWNIQRGTLEFGIRLGANKPMFYSLTGLPPKHAIYRIVPIADSPEDALITTTSPSGDYRTFRISLKKPKLTEIRVNGDPVYKSSVYGKYCAYTVKLPDRKRSVIVSDTYETITPIDVVLVSTGQVSQPPGITQDIVDAIDAFFDRKKPCTYPWCQGLRKAFDKDVEAAGGINCKDCRLGAIRRKYTLKIREILNPPQTVTP